MTAEVSEILHTGDLIVDGDIRSAADYSRDDLPDPYPEHIHASTVLGVIAAWEAAQEYKAMRHLGANNPSVRRQGGLAGCLAKSKQMEHEARRIFLTIHEFPSEQPYQDDEAALDSYYEGVKAWATFRGEISNPEIRQHIKGILEQKLPAVHRGTEG